VGVRFETENGRFSHIPDDAQIFVSLTGFVSEWVRFTRAVLEAVKTLQQELEGDELYQEYKMRLHRVELMLQRQRPG